MKQTVQATIYILIIILIGCNSGQFDSNTEKNTNEIQNYYTKYEVTGSFILYKLDGDTILQFNRQQFNQLFTPASTFKICNSLIGLETGIISSENYIIPWDSVQRQNPNWNQDTDLKMAFKNSTVWYYQELATRVGADTMKYWLDKLNYGNTDTTGGITEFWLSGGLRISPKQQINFIKRLIENTLPLQQHTMETVKEIMVFEHTEQYTLYGKTGWGFQDNEDIGWFVGFLETSNDSYIFSNCVQSKDPNNQNFGESRTKIVYDILKHETSIFESK